MKVLHTQPGDSSGVLHCFLVITTGPDDGNQISEIESARGSSLLVERSH